MSTEFNPMEGLLADLLSTWNEEPADELVEPAAAEMSRPVVTMPGGQSLPSISALLTPVMREPLFPELPLMPQPEPEEVPPVVPVKLMEAAVAETGAPLAEVLVPEPERVPERVPEPGPERVRMEDAGAAAACAAILARMESEFAQSEPVAMPARRSRMVSDAPRYVLFVVREMQFAVPLERVLETDRVAAITPLPGAAAGVRGLTNLRGEVVPVIDLRDVLGWPAAENSTARRMLVIHDGNRQPLTALLVDQVKGLAAFAHPAWKSAEMAGAHGAEGYVNAVAERDQEWVGLLNLERVLDETHLPSLAAA